MNFRLLGLLTVLGCGLSATLAAQQDGVTGGGIAWDVQGAGPVVVLIPGSNLDRRLWDDVAPALAATHRVIQYDLRAHGRSADVTGPFSHVEDLAEVLDAAGIRRASLVGLSAGSTVALDFALVHPDRVARLVLASPWPSGTQATERPAYLDSLMVLFRAGNIDGVAGLLADQPMFSAPAARAELARRMVVENARLFRQDPTQEHRTQPPALTRLALVAVPTLVIVGEKDNRDIRHAADTLVAVVPGARRVEMTGANHLLPLWDSDGFVRILLDFLRP